MKRAAAVALLFLLLLAVPAFAQDTVRATGMAAIAESTVDIARDKALDNAQRNAVEAQVGVMVTGFTEVEDFQVKVDQILSESRGFIRTYTIVSEGREGDSYKVTIDAVVESGRLKNRMEAIQLIMVRKSKPRVMFVFSNREKRDAVAEGAMSRYFLSRGFKVIDAATSRRLTSKFDALTEGGKAVTGIASRFGAEVLILVTVEAPLKSFRMGEIEVTSYDVTVAGRVVNGDTGDLVATASKSGKGEFKDTIESVATAVASRLQDDILDKWSSELTNTMSVKLFISGIRSYKELNTLKDTLKGKAKGVRAIHQRSYSRGRAELDLELRGNTQGLAEDLTALKINGKTVTILETTQNRISAKIGP